MKKFFSTVIFCVLIMATQISFAEQVKVQFNYQAHVQDLGWLPAVKNGGIAGTVGQNKRLEAILINLMNGTQSLIKYRAHVQNIGWQNWQISGSVAGTTGKGLRMEAVMIALTGEFANQFDIYYRAHVQQGGWLGWARNGEPAGTAGASLRMEALQIQIVPKGTAFKRGGQAFFEKKNSIGASV